MTTPKRIVSFAQKLGYDTAEYYGNKKGVSYFLAIKKESDIPQPTGYPIFVRLRGEKLDYCDGREVFPLFPDKD